MDRTRLLLALVLSMVVLIGWPLAIRLLAPPPPIQEISQEPLPPIEAQSPPPGRAEANKAESPARPAFSTAASDAEAWTTNAAPREITIDTEYYTAKFSNRGAVATSWILKKQVGRLEREIRAADGGPLELFPQDAIELLGAPLRLRLPWSQDLSAQLNQVYYQVDGAEAGEQTIHLNHGDQRQITFTYSSAGTVARKAFKFYGDRFIFDAAADVTAGGRQQPVEIVLGPRIGDQTDKQTGSYSTPPQVVAYDIAGERKAFFGSYITPPFAKITAIDPSVSRIQIDKPLAGDVNEIKFVTGDPAVFLGYARVIERDPSNLVLTLDSLPQGAAAGSGVAQGLDTLRGAFIWAGVVDHYFTMLAVPPQPVGEVALTNEQLKSDLPDYPVRDYPSVAVPMPAGSVTRIFVGPKDRELLASIGSELGTDLEALIDWGMFSFMIRPVVPAIGWALDGLGAVFNNYGWAIILVTIIINLALSPLKWYSSKKMKKAARHQPRMKELQDRLKKLKESPKKYEREMQELQREQMELMKEANPLGGCLPLLLQMPIFWAFFVFLTISLDVRHAPWVGWIRDLSTPDPYYVLPIIMCVTMIASTMLTPMPATADPSMKMQRIMMTWFMPIMLTWFFFFTAPSGLVLYWMVSNIVGVAIQLVINKMTAEPAGASVPAVAASGSRSAQGVNTKKIDNAKAGKKGESQRKRKASDKEIIEGAK